VGSTLTWLRKPGKKEGSTPLKPKKSKSITAWPAVTCSGKAMNYNVQAPD
jgi:hypothetical protein